MPFSSGREDLNLRPSAPEANALPGCATPRFDVPSNDAPFTRVFRSCQRLFSFLLFEDPPFAGLSDQVEQLIRSHIAVRVPVFPAVGVFLEFRCNVRHLRGREPYRPEHAERDPPPHGAVWAAGAAERGLSSRLRMSSFRWGRRSAMISDPEQTGEAPSRSRAFVPSG